MKYFSWLMLYLLFFCNPSLDGTWSLPITISPKGSVAQQIGLDASGTATALWDNVDGTTINVQYATLVKGGAWSPSKTITSFPSFGNIVSTASGPQIAISPKGYAVAVWAEFNEGLFSQVFASTRPIGGQWSPPVQISTGMNSAAPGQQVAIDPRGNAIAVWVEFNQGTVFIQSATLPFGGQWSTPMNVSLLTDSVEGIPQIGVDSAGNGYAIWAAITPLSAPNNVVQTSILPFGGNWTDPVQISSLTGSADTPTIAVNPCGKAVALWTETINSNSYIQAATQCKGRWTSPQIISSAGSSQFEGRSIAIDPKGRAVAVWAAAVGDDSLSQSASFISGSWTPPVNISAPNGTALYQQVALDSSGQVIAVWHRMDNLTGLFTIQAAMYTLGGSWTTPIDISGPNSFLPTIAMDPTGYAVVDWQNGITLSDSVIQAAEWTPPIPSHPSHFVGTIKKQPISDHPCHYLLKATWNPSPSPKVVLYRIYRCKKVVAQIQANSRLIFKTCLHSKSSGEKYSITAVDSDGLESDRVKLKIKTRE